jgi:hypothetical protein
MHRQEGLTFIERLKRPGEDWRILDELHALESDERIVEQLVVDQSGTKRVGWGAFYADLR